MGETFDFKLAKHITISEIEAGIVFHATLETEGYRVTWENDELPMIENGVIYTLKEVKEAVESNNWILVIN